MATGALPTAAWADAATPECPAPVAPTGELAPWSSPAPLAAASAVAGLNAAQITVGRSMTLSLHPVAHLSLPVAPKKADGNGGLVGLRVVRAGTYRVALSTAAWIDVIKAGKALESIAHGHGPACSGIHKIVDFTLTPGRYTIALSGNAEPEAQILVAKKP